MDLTIELMTRIADALERLAPPPPPPLDLMVSDGFVWHPSSTHLAPTARISRVEIDLLKGIDHQKVILMQNTLQFARGFSANNALLWGARGMGKSSLVKAAHAKALQEIPGSLALIEIHREDIRTLPILLNILRNQARRCLILCDDLSFENEDADYKALKSVLDGGIEGRPENVLFYATSNRRHLMPRDMIDNERSSAINPNEAIDEKISLSDRFGLWVGFHNCDQPTFLDMIDSYAAMLKLQANRAELHAAAIEWSRTRGTRSGRVAWQFIQETAGRLGATSADRVASRPTRD